MIDFDVLTASANSDAEFKIAGRYWDTRLELGFGATSTELLIVNGRIVATGAPGDFGDEVPLIRIAAPDSEWAKLLSASPPPGAADLALAPGFTVLGNILDRAPYFPAIQRLTALMREQVSGPADRHPIPEVERQFDDAVGRYVYVHVDGIQYRIYFEESGSGIPVVMMHTAGCDGRQWRHVLEDRDYQENFRLIAFDLPYHGRSLPPTTVEWWREEYRPTQRWITDVMLAVCDALDLDRPVFLGCSIGGTLAPALALHHPERFRSVIGVNGGLVGQYPPNDGRVPTDPEYSVTGYINSMFHPRIGDAWKGASMFGLTAPSSPEPYRRETAFGYAQGAPPIFHGDALLSQYEFPLTADEARQIDTSKVDVYLLTGEYDPFSLPLGADALNGKSVELANCIEGAYFAMIPDAGHFAPSDNPIAFKDALDPVMAEIAQRYG